MWQEQLSQTELELLQQLKSQESMLISLKEQIQTILWLSLYTEMILLLQVVQLIQWSILLKYLVKLLISWDSLLNLCENKCNLLNSEKWLLHIQMSLLSLLHKLEWDLLMMNQDWTQQLRFVCKISESQSIKISQIFNASEILMFQLSLVNN